jgi:hypothetical protein
MSGSKMLASTGTEHLTPKYMPIANREPRLATDRRGHDWNFAERGDSGADQHTATLFGQILIPHP